MKDYFEILNFIQKYGLSAIKIMVADEVFNALTSVVNGDVIITDDDRDAYNSICSTIYLLFLKYDDFTIVDLCEAFVIGFRDYTDTDIVESIGEYKDLDFETLIKLHL